jgi:hypothetical protein
MTTCPKEEAEEVVNTKMEQVTVLAVRIDCITRSREQSSLLTDIQWKKDV